MGARMHNRPSRLVEEMPSAHLLPLVNLTDHLVEEVLEHRTLGRGPHRAGPSGLLRRRLAPPFVKGGQPVLLLC